MCLRSLPPHCSRSIVWELQPLAGGAENWLATVAGAERTREMRGLIAAT